MSTTAARDGAWDAELERLERSGRVHTPWFTSVIRWLVDTHPGTRIDHIIDAGCGPGIAACLFADVVQGAHVSALDRSAAFLDRVGEHARRAGVSDRITPCLGDIDSALDGLRPADIVWASHVLHHVADPARVLGLLGTWLTDTGRLVIAEGGLPTRVLPGAYGVARPGFASRLDAAMAEHAVATWGLHDAAVGGARDWPVLIGDAGLVADVSRTFVLEYRAPLDDEVRRDVVEHHRHMRELISGRLDPADVAALDILCDPEDHRSLHRRPDLFVLTALTVHVARRP